MNDRYIYSHPGQLSDLPAAVIAGSKPGLCTLECKSKIWPKMYILHFEIWNFRCTGPWGPNFQLKRRSFMLHFYHHVYLEPNSQGQTDLESKCSKAWWWEQECQHSVNNQQLKYLLVHSEGTWIRVPKYIHSTGKMPVTISLLLPLWDLIKSPFWYLSLPLTSRLSV